MIWLKERWFAWKITSAFGNSTQFSNFSQEQSFGMFQHYAITHHGNGRMDTCLEVKFWPFLSEILDPQQIVFKSSAILEFLVNLFRNDARKTGNVALWKSWKDHIFFATHLRHLGGGKYYTKVASIITVSQGWGMARQLARSQMKNLQRKEHATLIAGLENKAGYMATLVA